MPDGQSKPLITHLQVQDGQDTRDVDIYDSNSLDLLAQLWTRAGWNQRQSYECTWLGVPIIQLPEDILMMQELIYKIRPDVILETGTAHGGTAIFYASMLELIGRGRVVSIDVEIRKYNRLAIQAHPMSRRITLIDGSSIDDETETRINKLIRPHDTVLVALDSNHSYHHVRAELERYAKFVSPGSYLVVFDGVMDIVYDAPNGSSSWETDNPTIAVRDFLEEHPEFEVDPYYNRMRVTYCPGGYLRRSMTD
jgi:cephalosporin hydroxylase